MSNPSNIPKQLHQGRGSEYKDPGDAGTITVDRTPCYVSLTSAAAETRTLAIPTKAGAQILLAMHTDGGDITLTVTGGFNEDAETSFVFSDPGQFLKLEAVDVGGTMTWRKTADYVSGNISPTELAWLNGVTAGTAAASKAMVTDASNNIGSLAKLAIGAAVPTNPEARLAILPGAASATADQSYFHEQILPGGAITIPTGTAPVVASLNVHEPNITATGTVTVAATVRIVDAPTEGSSNYALWVDAGVTRLDGNLLFSAALDVVTAANTAVALEVTDATTSLIAIDTRNTVSVVTHTIQGPASQTLPDAATARSRTVSIAAKTVTLVGQTQVTTLNEGSQLEILAPTYNQSGGAVTVDKVSTLFVGTPVAGGSVTISTNHIIMTGTAGCFCTAAGTWTDTSSRHSKRNVRAANMRDVADALDAVEVVQFRKIEKSDGDYDRFGVIAEDVPDCLASNSREGVASIYMAGLTLAGVKLLQNENAELKKRLEALEARV